MYLVTGGTGFIGSYVVKNLLLQREKVISYDSIFEKKPLLRRLVGVEKSDYVKFINGDITDRENLINICKRFNVESIIHLAAVVDSGNPYQLINVNCSGTINVLEVCRSLGIKKVVLASSRDVFGPHLKYVQEYIPNDAPHYPSEIYGASKSFNETIARIYFNKYGLDAISIRLQEVYGFGRRESRRAAIHEELFVKPAIGRPGVVTNGDGYRNWMYVEDAARAMIMASKVNKTKTRAFTANGDVRPTKEVAAYVRKLIPNADITLLPGATNYPYKFDTTPIQMEIGYEPEWTIELGVQKYIVEIRNSYEKFV